jgi:hypothetical protein
MKIEASNFRPYEKNTLKGLVTLALALRARYPDIFKAKGAAP